MKWKQTRKPDKMLRAEHYETSEAYDKKKIYNTRFHKRTKPREPDRVPFMVNQKWAACYGGR